MNSPSPDLCLPADLSRDLYSVVLTKEEVLTKAEALKTQVLRPASAGLRRMEGQKAYG